MRKLKHHERKLLKKVDFLQWKNEHNLRELQARPCRHCPLPPLPSRRRPSASGAAQPSCTLLNNQQHQGGGGRAAGCRGRLCEPRRGAVAAPCRRGARPPCRPPSSRRALRPAPPPPRPRPQVMRRYHIQNRDDYKAYNRLVGMVTKLTATLKRLDARDATRIDLTDRLLNKCGGPAAVGERPAALPRAAWPPAWPCVRCLRGATPPTPLASAALLLLFSPCLLVLPRRLYDMGAITTKKSLAQLEKLSTAAFCRRRLAVVMVRPRRPQGRPLLCCCPGAAAWAARRAQPPAAAPTLPPAAPTPPAGAAEDERDTARGGHAHRAGPRARGARHRCARRGGGWPCGVTGELAPVCLLPTAAPPAPASPAHLLLPAPPPAPRSDGPRVPGDAGAGGLGDVGGHEQDPAQGAAVQ